MDPLTLLISGGVECGKLLLMAYLENQKIQGKSKEEILAYAAGVAEVYFNLPDPQAILDELAKTVAAQKK